jgi:hypothetical protein
MVLLGACSSNKEASTNVKISGRVFEAGKATAIANLSVVMPDGTRTKSDGEGDFTSQSKSGKSVRIEGEGYAPTSKPAPKGDGYLELYAKATDAKENLQPSKGGEVSSNKGGKVNVPSNAFTSKEGKDPEEAIVELAVVDARKSTDLPSLPGDFDARKGSKSGKVSAESPMYLTAKDGGKSLDVAKGKSLEASFPARRAGSNATLFHFDEDKQEWQSRGEAPRSKNKAGESSYEVQLDALGWWTVGEFYDRLTCVRACVVGDDDKPAPFARAVATGIDHFTQLASYAGEDGCFALTVRASAQVSLTVQARDGYVPARVLKTSDEEIDLARDASDCQDLGELVLIAHKVNRCPQGLGRCNDACVDVSNDSDSCGRCGVTCGGTEGRELSCIAGECGCPLGSTECNGGVGLAHCALRSSDVENCGGCGIACAEGEQCRDGVCSGEGGETDAGTDAGMDGGIDAGSAASCFPAGVSTPACELCSGTCCETCTGACPLLLACAYEKCRDPRECALAQLCPNEATPEAMTSLQAFLSCTSSTCGSICETPTSDGGPTVRSCSVIPITTQQCDAGPTCLGASRRIQCSDGTTTTTYDWRVTGPVNSQCSVLCQINDMPTGSACTYAPNVCGDPDVTTVPCDPGCVFPSDIAVPPFGLPLPTSDAGVDPQTTPGNDTAGTVSCGGDATSEVPCVINPSQACCMAGQATATCTSSTGCVSTTQAVCDGPEDCTTGEVCCISDDGAMVSVRTQCLAQCPPSAGEIVVSVACHVDSDCPTTFMCIRDPGSVRQFWGTCVSKG